MVTEDPSSVGHLRNMRIQTCAQQWQWGDPLQGACAIGAVQLMGTVSASDGFRTFAVTIWQCGHDGDKVKPSIAKVVIIPIDYLAPYSLG